MNKNSLVVVIIVVILLIALFVLPPFFESPMINYYNEHKERDWNIEIGNGYEIQKLNGNDIILVKNGWSANTNIVISSYINAYCCNDVYIGIWCAKMGPSFLPKANNPEDVFYLIDMQQDIMIGRYTKTEYEDFCYKNDIGSLMEWVYTS